jgi:hypothetical protein
MTRKVHSNKNVRQINALSRCGRLVNYRSVQIIRSVEVEKSGLRMGKFLVVGLVMFRTIFTEEARWLA